MACFGFLASVWDLNFKAPALRFIQKNVILRNWFITQDIICFLTSCFHTNRIFSFMIHILSGGNLHQYFVMADNCKWLLFVKRYKISSGVLAVVPPVPPIFFLFFFCNIMLILVSMKWAGISLVLKDFMQMHQMHFYIWLHSHCSLF